MGYVLLFIAVLLNTAANLLFKHAAALPEWTKQKGGLFLLALALGLGNTLLYIKALEKLDLGIAYPLLSASSIVLLAGLSVLFFKEALSLQKILALCTICVGMLMLWRA
ncbi:MAG: EamA family transporter [Ignavibacteriae bacterium]|nr:EamA family transporter [Ignavibacteriota bacterium]